MQETNQSLSTRVYQRLEDDILGGRYQTNEELKESTIGKELGVSRTPVREALRQLEQQGLVEITPNRGARVIGLTREDFYDIFMIRSMLEGYCAAKAAKNATPEQIAELEEIVYLAQFHVERGHSEQIFEEDNRFHEVIYQASGSKILENLLSNFHHYLLRVRRVTLKSMERAKKSNEEHAAILEAIRSHDEEAAKELANRHIMSTMENIRRCGWDTLFGSESQEEKSHETMV